MQETKGLLLTQKNTLLLDLVAFTTVAIWGTTFVWTKLLIINGLSPAQIFTLRFIISYILLCGFSLTRKKSHRWFSDNWKDELVMILLGVTGGSMYFLTENEALRFTTATNTSLIVCSCPLFTALIVGLCYKAERYHRRQVIGTLMALAGMAIVVLNGHFVLHLSPLGDFLAFSACISWAFYSLLMKRVMGRYSSMMITRKVFFYGILTILPYYLFVPDFPSVEVLTRPSVLANLLFLGSVASMLCFLTWSWCMKGLGAVRCTNYVYFNPITTIVAAWLILNEQITIFFLIGSALIIGGMVLMNKK